MLMDLRRADLTVVQIKHQLWDSPTQVMSRHHWPMPKPKLRCNKLKECWPSQWYSLLWDTRPWYPTKLHCRLHLHHPCVDLIHLRIMLGVMMKMKNIDPQMAFWKDNKSAGMKDFNLPHYAGGNGFLKWIMDLHQVAHRFNMPTEVILHGSYCFIRQLMSESLSDEFEDIWSSPTQGFGSWSEVVSIVT